MSHSSQRASETSTCSATLTPASSKASSRAARASVKLVSGARGGKNPSHSERFRTHRRRLSAAGRRRRPGRCRSSPTGPARSLRPPGTPGRPPPAPTPCRSARDRSQTNSRRESRPRPAPSRLAAMRTREAAGGARPRHLEGFGTSPCRARGGMVAGCGERAGRARRASERVTDK